MILKYQIMDNNKMHRALTRIAYEIVEKNDGADDIVLIGIKKRGVPLAELIAENIKKAYDVDIPIGVVDISHKNKIDINHTLTPQIKATDIQFNIDKKTLILVDDVLFTGKTVMAAIDIIFNLGNPDKIQLAVLIDRGHRKLPIRADFVGKNVPTSLDEIVSVNTMEFDNKENVLLYELKK